MQVAHVATRWKLLLHLLSHLPQGMLSRLTGRMADVRIPRPLRGLVLRAFARAARIDPDEAGRPIVDYPTLDAFFVRALRPGSRSWPEDRSLLASPVDGIVGECGRIAGGRLIQAKGRLYSAERLLDDDEAAGFRDGAFLTLYLSPRHCHRVHSPVDGLIRRVRHVPGALLPVNPPALHSIDDLFPRNERVAVWIESAAGRVALVAVGAYNVGRITASFDASIRTNRRGALPRTHVYHPPVPVARGDELLAFHLGSTVVLLFEAGIRLSTELRSDQEIRVGQPVAAPGT